MQKKILCFTILLTIFSCSSIYPSEVVIDQAWQDIQSVTRDAVVHIFATSRPTNWFNPYVVCGTTTFTGTGFFINEEGYIATCSHVIDHALAVYVSIPALGKQRLRAHVVGICPQYDVALLKLDEKALALMNKELGEIKYLPMGDSDIIQRGENVLSLGYPGTTLEMDQVKGTVGVISARLNCVFQFDAPTNPGNSGGPLLNKQGAVIGITTSQVTQAQNSNFAIPINTFKNIAPALHEHRLLRLNHNGIIWVFTNKEARDYFKCPTTHGCLVCDVTPLSLAEKVGIQADDIVYAVNNYLVDCYGEIDALYDNEKMRFDYYIDQQPDGAETIVKVYRDGKPIEFIIKNACADPCSVLMKYPTYEKIDYEIFAGMIIMPLTLNYIQACAKDRPGLQRYLTNLHACFSRLAVVNVFSDSKVCHMDTIRYGDTINEVNGQKVATLQDFRQALAKSSDTGYVVIKTTDEITLDTDNVLTILSFEDSCTETAELSRVHCYPLSESTKELIAQMDDSLLL